MSSFTRPELYPKQEAAIFNDSRFCAIEASTKSGKTVGCIAWLVEQAFAGGPGDNYWWVAPVFPQADIAYRRIKQFLTQGSFTSFASPQPRIELISGGTIWIKSGDNPDSLYGEDVKAAVMDEASRNKEEAWHALRSTLAATMGKGRLIGNLKGRKNFFYKLARRAEKKELPGWHYAKLTVVDAIEAGVIDSQEVEDARRTLPDWIFRELYYAEPADDGGNPFGIPYIQECIQPLSQQPVAAWGVDLAKKQDYLVLIGLDADCAVAQFHRWHGVPWRDSISRIHRIIGDECPTLVDSTGIGDPVLEELQKDHNNFYGYMFSMAGKQKIMEGLAVSIQGKDITFPAGPIVEELESFEYKTLPSGRVVYQAAEGYPNDDCVCALALARQILTEAQPGQNMIGYYKDTLSTVSSDAQRAGSPAEDPPPVFSQRTDVSASEQLGNELTELYLETLEGLQPTNDVLCHRCGLPVIKSTGHISDGEYIWHFQCS